MKILILGSLTVDIIEGRKVKGGPAYFCSLAAELLGINYFCCGVKPEEYCWDEPKGIFITSKGPIFEHKYVGGERISRLIAEPDVFDEELPDPTLFDFIFVNPVYGEFKIGQIRSMTKHAKVIIDSQGFLREVRDNRIVIRKIGEDELELFKKCWAVHISIDELSAFETIPNEPIVLITFGEKGAKVRFKGKEYFIPAYSVKGDPTGAGDFFMVSFAAEYMREGDVVEAALYAASLTSLFVERVIPRNLRSVRGLLSKIEPILNARLETLRRKIKQI